jgi:hypothetical protein
MNALPVILAFSWQPTMNRLRTLGLCLLLGTVVLQGQAQLPAPGSGDALESLRIAFMTEQLALSPAEAEKFWPLYREYQTKRQALEGDIAQLATETLSDAELEKRVLDHFSTMESVSALNRQYLTAFKTVLPARKAAMVFLLEHRFRARLIETMRERMAAGRSAGGPGPR